MVGYYDDAKKLTEFLKNKAGYTATTDGPTDRQSGLLGCVHVTKNLTCLHMQRNLKYVQKANFIKNRCHEHGFGFHQFFKSFSSDSVQIASTPSSFLSSAPSPFSAATISASLFDHYSPEPPPQYQQPFRIEVSSYFSVFNCYSPQPLLKFCSFLLR